MDRMDRMHPKKVKVLKEPRGTVRELQTESSFVLCSDDDEAEEIPNENSPNNNIKLSSGKNFESCYDRYILNNYNDDFLSSS